MTRLPPLYALQVFAVVAHEKNMSRAAGRLHLTQSAVSRQIALLEESLGQKVCVRHARGVELTAAGKQLLPSVDKALAELAHAVERIGQRPNELRIKLPPTLAARWFMPRLNGFRRANPEINLRVSCDDCAAVHFELEDMDAAVIFAREAPRHCDAVELFPEQLTVVCGRDAAARINSPHDLVNEQLIHLSADHSDWRRWLEIAGVTHPAVDTGPIFEVIDMAVNLAEQDMGLAIGDPRLLMDDLRCKRLVAPFADWVLETGFSYWFACPRGRYKEAPMQTLVEWMRRELVGGAEQSCHATGP
jgi:LysR family glycine cleavage system transcriptional activator